MLRRHAGSARGSKGELHIGLSRSTLMLSSIGADMEALNRQGLFEALEGKNISMSTNKEIVGKGHGVINRVSGGKQFIKGDFVVLALGAEPSDNLAEKLKGKVPGLHVVGDAKEPGGRQGQSTKAL